MQAHSGFEEELGIRHMQLLSINREVVSIYGAVTYKWINLFTDKDLSWLFAMMIPAAGVMSTGFLRMKS